jgi:CubicO group peptidase (beta-lactamase class C family)
MPELDRRTFLKTAAGSSVLVTPATLIAQSPQTTPGRPSAGDDTERRDRAGGSGGLSKARLGRMHDVMAGYVDRGQVPGLATLVSRRGEVHLDVIGMKAAGGNDPMRRDTIFRIASMSKPITAAAVMILVEESNGRLDESVDRLLPELANRKVLKRLDGPLDDTVPAKRPITVRDLLTFRWGFGLVLAPPDAYPILIVIQNDRFLLDS